MENKKIIIILLLIIIVLAVAVGFLLLNPIKAKEPTKLQISNNTTLTENDNLTIKLTDINGNPIFNQTINVSITDKDGAVNHKSVVTNEKGKAILEIDKNPGNYSINCTFEGSDNYTNCTVFKTINIKETENTDSSQYSSYDSQSHSSQSSNGDYRPAVDSSGITREEADKYGWKYTNKHGGHYIGSRDHWDEKAGVYHD